MKMVDMKRTEKDKRVYDRPTVTNLPSYPYGLSLSFDATTCKKLGIGKSLTFGDKIALNGIAAVNRVDSDGLGLQVVKLAAKKMTGKGGM